MIRLLGKYGGISVGKAYMKLAGVDCGDFRLPVMNMTASDFDRFAEDATAVGFREFQSK
jgi:N-acetylneuraminate lyase